MKINLSKVGADIISALKKYPMEALLGLLFFVFFCIEDQLSWESSSELIKHIRDVMSLFPAFMVLVYSLHQLLYFWTFDANIRNNLEIIHIIP